MIYTGTVKGNLQRLRRSPLPFSLSSLLCVHPSPHMRIYISLSLLFHRIVVSKSVRFQNEFFRKTYFHNKNLFSKLTNQKKLENLHNLKLKEKRIRERERKKVWKGLFLKWIFLNGQFGPSERERKLARKSGTFRKALLHFAVFSNRKVIHSTFLGSQKDFIRFYSR